MSRFKPVTPTCEAVAYGDRTSCSCGNQWDTNDPNPPACPKIATPATAAAAGKKYDAGKLRYDLVPFKAMDEVVKVLTFGADKYGPNNWQKLDQAHDRYVAAALRHLSKHQQGELVDPESGLSHLAHAACCVLFLLHGEVTA